MQNKCNAIFSLYLFAGICLLGCTPPNTTIDPTSINVVEDNTPTTTTSVSIEYIKGLYNGNSYLITQNLAIEGVITANDVYGEFPTSLIIEDESGAIEIMCDFDCAASGFIFGATIQVLCNGLWIGSTGGMLSMGGAPEGQESTTQISQEQGSIHLRLCSDDCIIPQPTVTTISNLTTNHILRYVLINNLRFEDTATTFCTRNAESGKTEYTSHTLIDMWDNTISLEVDTNVIYADDELPEGLRSIYAIVEYFVDTYRLRITNCGY